MNHDDLGNYSHSYVADLRAQLQAANERAEVLTIYEQRLDEARRERDIAEQTNAALKAEVERLTKKCDEWKACAERVDARMLHEQSDHNKTVDRLIAARALNDRLAGALMAIPPCDVSMDASFVYKTSGWRWAEAMEKRAVALSAYAKSVQGGKT